MPYESSLFLKKVKIILGKKIGWAETHPIFESYETLTQSKYRLQEFWIRTLFV